MSDGGPVPISLEPGQIQRAPQTLAQKLVAAALAIETVEKDKRNTFHKYDYASIEAVVSAVRGELLKRGVLVLAGEADTQDRTRATREGESVVTTVHLVFTLLDAETGERLEIPWLGRGDDPADKGVAKALTDARKSFLIQQLNLSRGEDTEADPTTDERSAGASGTVNLIPDAKGLRDQQLNEILVANGLPAAQAPFGAFARIPSEKAPQIRSDLESAKQPVTA
jgi:hypothetical protein